MSAQAPAIVAPHSDKWKKQKKQVEEELKELFVSHANVFDATMQDYILENFIQDVRAPPLQPSFYGARARRESSWTDRQNVCV